MVNRTITLDLTDEEAAALAGTCARRSTMPAFPLAPRLDRSSPSSGGAALADAAGHGAEGRARPKRGGARATVDIFPNGKVRP
jgi:hypothetical protein